MNRAASLLLLSILKISTLANASYFDENTTIETSDIGAQIVDILGDSLIETRDSWGYLLPTFYAAILFFLFIISLILIIILGINHKKGK